MMKYNTLCIIQARTGSTRLPNKVLMEVDGVPLLEYEIQRVRRAKLVAKIVVATTKSTADDAIEALCKRMNVDCLRGSEENVLDRFHDCVLRYPEYNTIIRLTGDCPLIDSELIDQVIALFETGDCDYASNFVEETFPNGVEVEVFTRAALLESAKKATLLSEREHVTWYMRNTKKFQKKNLSAPQDFSRFRFTVDEKEDFEVVKFLIQNSNINDGYEHHIALLKEHPEIMQKNAHIKRNEGLAKSLKADKRISAN